jgi:VanZ family protein
MGGTSGSRRRSQPQVLYPLFNLTSRDALLTRSLWLWAPVIVVMAAIFWLSSQPVLPTPGHLTDKESHGLAYGTVAALWYRALGGGRWRGLTARRGLWAATAAVVYGVTDEWHQSFVPPRTAEFADLLADATGAVVAAIVLYVCGIIAARRTTSA